MHFQVYSLIDHLLYLSSYTHYENEKTQNRSLIPKQYSSNVRQSNYRNLTDTYGLTATLLLKLLSNTTAISCSHCYLKLYKPQLHALATATRSAYTLDHTVRTPAATP